MGRSGVRVRLARRTAAERGDPPNRAVDAPLHVRGARRYAATPDLAMAAPHPRAADARRRRLRLWALPFWALLGGSGLRRRQDRDRERDAVVPDDCPCWAARPPG